MRKFIVPIVGVMALTPVAGADEVTFMIRSLRPAQGGVLSPMLITTHNGGFDQFDPGSAASMAVERIAEDGDFSVLQTAALGTAGVSSSTAPGGGPILPGETRMFNVQLNPAMPSSRYFSFLSMFVPSNDAFIGNADPMAFELFDANGNLVQRQGATAIRIMGSMVWDAGTEVNDELPGNALGLGPSAPNTGVTEGGVVHMHPGFIGSLAMGGAPGNILTAAPNADFTVPGFEIVEISVVPAPGAAAVLGLAGFMFSRRRR